MIILQKHVPSLCLLALLGFTTLASAQTKPNTPSVATKTVPEPNGPDHWTLDFGAVTQEYIQFRPLTFTMPANLKVQSIDIDDAKDFAEVHDEQCNKTVGPRDCFVLFGFVPGETKSYDDTGATIQMSDGSTKEVDFSGVGTASCTMPNRATLPTIYPQLPADKSLARSGRIVLAEQLASEMEHKLHLDPYLWSRTNEATINCYYATDGPLAFFTQIRSIYNAASQSATITANVGSYNFNNGMQVSLGTNIQAGPSGTPPTTVSSGSLANLSATSAAQAAQNLFFGGNLYLYDDLPLLTKRNYDLNRWHFSTDIFVREGVDLQNFSGTSTMAKSPTSHFNVFDEAYYQYDANSKSGDSTTTVPLALYIAGQYGYGFTSHAYARDYGFGKKVNSQLGDVAFGILVTGVFDISVMREFGPTQQYIDSTSSAFVKVNNFKTFSFGVTYQSKGVSASN